MASGNDPESDLQYFEGNHLSQVLHHIVKCLNLEDSISNWPVIPNKLRDDIKESLNSYRKTIKTEWKSYWIWFHGQELVKIEDAVKYIYHCRVREKTPRDYNRPRFSSSHRPFAEMVYDLENLNSGIMRTHQYRPQREFILRSVRGISWMHCCMKHIQTCLSHTEKKGFDYLHDCWPVLPEEAFEDEQELMTMTYFKESVIGSWGICWKTFLDIEDDDSCLQGQHLLNLIESVHSRCTSLTYSLPPSCEIEHEVCEKAACKKLLKINEWWQTKLKTEAENPEENILDPSMFSGLQVRALQLWRIMRFCIMLIRNDNHDLSQMNNVRERLPICKTSGQETEPLLKEVEKAIKSHWKVNHKQKRKFLKKSLRGDMRHLSTDPDIKKYQKDEDLLPAVEQLEELLRNVCAFLNGKFRNWTEPSAVMETFPFLLHLHQCFFDAKEKHMTLFNESLSFERSEPRQKEIDSNRNYSEESLIKKTSTQTEDASKESFQILSSLCHSFVSNLLEDNHVFREEDTHIVIQGINDDCKQELEKHIESFKRLFQHLKDRQMQDKFRKTLSDCTLDCLEKNEKMTEENVNMLKEKIPTSRKDTLLEELQTSCEIVDQSFEKFQNLEREQGRLEKRVRKEMQEKDEKITLLEHTIQSFKKEREEYDKFREILHEKVLQCMQEKRSFDEKSIAAPSIDKSLVQSEIQWAETVVDAVLATSKELKTEKPIKTNPQNDPYSAYEKEMEGLKREKAVLLNRLSQLAGSRLKDGNAAITDLSDPNRPLKIAEQYGEIYDSDWTNALEDLSQDGSKSEIDHITFLLEIMKNSYEHCVKSSEKQWNDIASSFCYDENMDLKALQLSDIEMQQMKIIRKSTAEKSKHHVLQDFMMDKKRLYEEFKESKAVSTFIQKCITVCWYMVVQDPPLVIKSDFEKGEKLDTNVLKEYTRRGSIIAFMVWPALFLHENGPLLSKGVAQPVPDRPKTARF